MNYALIENGIVVNVIVWDGDTSTWAPPAEFSALAIPAESIATIGWLCDGTNFTAPPPPTSP
jgi:hypothetical protein